MQKELGDDFGVLPFPKDGRGRAVGAGRRVRRGGQRPQQAQQAAKDYLKWLWVDRTDYQEDFALSYGFHIPARISLAKKAAEAPEGRGGRRGAASPPTTATPNRCCGHRASRTAYQDALSRIIKDGATRRAS